MTVDNHSVIEGTGSTVMTLHFLSLTGVICLRSANFLQFRYIRQGQAMFEFILFEWLCLIIYTVVYGLGITSEIRFNSRLKRSRQSHPIFEPELNNNTHLISIVIPAYNEQEVIEMTISSILESDYLNIELFAVDDGSLDNTADIISLIAARDNRVHLVRQARNCGKAAALNAGLKLCAGEYVIVVDADTRLGSDFVRRMIDPILRNDADATAGNIMVGNRQTFLGKCQAVEYRFFHLTRTCQSLSQSVTTIAGAAGAFRRSALQEVSGYSSLTKAEDTHLTLMLRQHGSRVSYIPNAAVYTEVPSSWRCLFKQRARWYYGAIQCIAIYYRGRINRRSSETIAGIGSLLYENLFAPVISLGRSAIPLVFLLGFGSKWVLWADAFVFACFWSATSGQLKRSGEYFAPAATAVFMYALYPYFLIFPFLHALSSFVLRRSISWGKADRHGMPKAAAKNSSALDCVKSGTEELGGRLRGHGECGEYRGDFGRARERI